MVMETATSILLSLPGLAKALNLPETWLKAEADARRIPHLRIDKRYRFNLEAVERSLAERAATGAVTMGPCTCAQRDTGDKPGKVIGEGLHNE